MSQKNITDSTVHETSTGRTSLNKPMTHEALDRAVETLRHVGGLYEIIALWVEHDNRPHCVGERDAATN